MIQKLDHTSSSISKNIRAVFQASYAVEAKLLKATDFPPLKRNLGDFLKSKTDFYGFYIVNKLVAVTEISSIENVTHIQSLVVLPDYFKQGIASKLITFVLKNYSSLVYTVETGINNIPATTLYKKFGFEEIKQWNTDHGVRKVRFEKRATA